MAMKRERIDKKEFDGFRGKIENLIFELAFMIYDSRIFKLKDNRIFCHIYIII